MWGITSYYNPIGYKRRLSNYRIFRANLRVPLVTVELSFNGRFELSDDDADILIQLSDGAVLWQKERLLNLAVKAVPSDVDKIAWLDCDVILDRTDWIDEATRQLDEFSVVQLFSDAIHLEPEQCVQEPARHTDHCAVPGIATLPNARELLEFGANQRTPPVYQEGLAWATHRRLLEDHSFYDAAIVGGGDSLMMAAMYGRYEGLMRRCMFNASRRDHYLRWAKPFQNSVAERIGHIPGTIYHLPHGQIKNRAYRDRHRRLAALDFDPDTDIKVGGNGAWHWARRRPDLEAFLQEYFVTRAEDE